MRYVEPPTSLPLNLTEVQFEVEESSPSGLGSVSGSVAQWTEGALVTLRLEWPDPSPERLAAWFVFPDFRDYTAMGAAHTCAVSIRTPTNTRTSVWRPDKGEADLRMVTGGSVPARDSVTYWAAGLHWPDVLEVGLSWPHGNLEAVLRPLA